jgi:hypothetical protein
LISGSYINKGFGLKKSMLIRLMIVPMAFTLMNCSGMKFSKGGSTGSSSSSSTDGSDPDGGLGSGGDGTNPDGTSSTGGTGTNTGGSSTGTVPITGGTGGTGTTTTTIVYPKAYYESPICVRDFNYSFNPCPITFKLKQAMIYDTDFDWHTNDTAYQNLVPPVGKIIANPNVDYYSTGGHIHFPAGQTSVTVYVNNRSPYPQQILIYFIMSSCKYKSAAVPGDCFVMFQ